MTSSGQPRLTRRQLREQNIVRPSCLGNDFRPADLPHAHLQLKAERGFIKQIWKSRCQEFIANPKSVTRVAAIAAIGLFAFGSPVLAGLGFDWRMGSSDRAAHGALNEQTQARQVANGLTPLLRVSKEAISPSSNDDQIAQVEVAKGQPGLQCSANQIPANTPDLVVRPVAEGFYHYSSPFAVDRGGGFHAGVDMAAPLGTVIRAAASGTVVHVGEGIDGRSSYLIAIKHHLRGHDVWTWYVHMYQDGIFVKEGDQVTAGQVIAAVGSNGNSTGPHLHFEVHTDKFLAVEDPVPWLEKFQARDITQVCEVPTNSLAK